MIESEHVRYLIGKDAEIECMFLSILWVMFETTIQLECRGPK